MTNERRKEINELLRTADAEGPDAVDTLKQALGAEYVEYSQRAEESYLAAAGLPTRRELTEDIVALYERGYIRHLDARCDPPHTIDALRSVLRDAGFTDAQVDARDYC